jgi:membrane fusion protein (multidrug efflux system)
MSSSGAVAPPPSQGLPQASAAPAPRKRRAGRWILLVLLICVLAAGADGAWRWWQDGRFVVSTDDAYVRGDVATLATRLPGHVVAIEVRNGDRVRAGDVIAQLDDGDIVLAIAAARARIATQRAAIARLARQADTARAVVVQAEAELAGLRAADTLAQSELVRYTALAARDHASRARLDQAQAERQRSAAALVSAEAAIATARARVEVARAEMAEAERILPELETTLARAERDRDFASIRAPFDGIVGNRAVQPGEFVQSGARIAALVPIAGLWVEANFKETHLARLKPGQAVRIEVDALPGQILAGRVESFSPASGAVFSLLPPENATGNFTKIVQRVPVRVALPDGAAAPDLLRPGLSVLVRIDTRDPGTGAGAAARPR